MNIFEEIAESYTYNGVVSLKALDDDIVTLENQIDSYNATLREIQLRGKKSAPLVQKIRDAKIRLSLLKAVYKKESDRNTSDDIILNMLGISANNAKEVELPKTAAEGKEPLVQDFEESDVEVVEEMVEDTEAVVSEKENTEDIVTEEDEVVETPADELVREENIEDIVTEGDDVVETPADDLKCEENVEDLQAVETIEPESEKKIYRLGHEIDINEGTGDVIIEQSSTSSHTEYFIPKEEEVDNITYSGQLENNTAEAISVDETVKLPTGKPEDCDYECPPPPGLGDYFEPTEEFDASFYSPECDNEVDTVQCQKEDEIDDSKNVVTYEDNSEMNEVSVELSDTKDIAYDFPAYDAFPDEPISEIYSSFDLSPYTDMVNTDSVVGVFDNKRKILEVTFHDIRDYSIFIKLMKQKRPGLFSFLEKPKSIFMDVHERHGDEEKIYHYEFTNCKLKNLWDSRYLPKSETVTTETVSHECTAVFKYKKLKLT